MNFGDVRIDRDDCIKSEKTKQGGIVGCDIGKMKREYETNEINETNEKI